MFLVSMAHLTQTPKNITEYNLKWIFSYGKKKVQICYINFSLHFVVVALVQIDPKKVWNIPEYIFGWCLKFFLNIKQFVWIQLSIFIHLDLC